MNLSVPRILWGAIFASTFVIFGVMLVAVPARDGSPGSIMLATLATAAVASLIASFVVPTVQRRQAFAKLEIATRQEAVEDPARAESDVLPYRETATVMRSVAADPEAVRRRALALYQTHFIFGVALSESIALYGFCVGFLGFPLSRALPFFVVSWIAIAVRFPTVDKVLGPLERARGVYIPRA